jgi:hypothetical protein
MISCQTCDTVLSYHYADDQPLYCERCLDAAWTLSCLCEQQKTPAKPRRRANLSIEQMIMRIGAHPGFGELAASIRQDLAQIGRFDRRRSTDDNNYVRGVWHYLQNSSVSINVHS